jgi:hypothetical protein
LRTRFKAISIVVDLDEYREDFGDVIYDEINMDWYSPSIHDVYFDNDYVDNNIIYNDNNGAMINSFLGDNLKVGCK